MVELEPTVDSAFILKSDYDRIEMETRAAIASKILYLKSDYDRIEIQELNIMRKTNILS